MKTKLIVVSLLLLGLVGCSTVESRVAKNRPAYDSWPPQVQQMVNAGQIAVGFTTDQVRVALGEPDHVFTRTAATGSFEVWSYADKGPRFSFGIGMGSFGRHSGYAGGVGVNTSPSYPEEKLRVVFDGYGRVSSIEQVRRG